MRGATWRHTHVRTRRSNLTGCWGSRVWVGSPFWVESRGLLRPVVDTSLNSNTCNGGNGARPPRVRSARSSLCPSMEAERGGTHRTQVAMADAVRSSRPPQFQDEAGAHAPRHADSHDLRLFSLLRVEDGAAMVRLAFKHKALAGTASTPAAR